VTVVDVAIIRPGRGSVDPRWLVYAINAPQARTAIESMQSGTTRKRISRKNLGTVELRVAPLAEQPRIVAAIEEAFSKLDAGEAGLRNVRQLLTRMRDVVLTAAVTGRLVPQDPTDTPAAKLLADLGVVARDEPSMPEGWARATVGDLLDRIEAGKSFAALGRPAEAGEVGVIKVSAMTWGEFRPDENKAIPDGAVIDERWRIRGGDLLFSRANTSEYVGAMRSRTARLPAAHPERQEPSSRPSC
jgi:type I restriction enzyme S subunit